MSEEQPALGVQEQEEEQQQSELNQEQQFNQEQQYNPDSMQGEDMAYPSMQDNQQYGYYDDDADRRSPPAEQQSEGNTHQQMESSGAGKIFVGGVSWQTNENSLRNYFGKFGELDDVALMMDKRTGQPRGFGFVTFKDPAGEIKVSG